jgi:acetyltransferase-like isoleucine patch superfamily enzyme
VVGAGSVVNSEIPEYAIVKGNPAVVVGYRKQMK